MYHFEKRFHTTTTWYTTLVIFALKRRTSNQRSGELLTIVACRIFLASSLVLVDHLTCVPTIHPSIHAPVHPFIYSFIQYFIHLSTHPSTYLSTTHQPMHKPAHHPSIYLSVIHPSIYPFIHHHIAHHVSFEGEEWVVFLGTIKIGIKDMTHSFIRNIIHVVNRLPEMDFWGCPKIWFTLIVLLKQIQDII